MTVEDDLRKAGIDPTKVRMEGKPAEEIVQTNLGPAVVNSGSVDTDNETLKTNLGEEKTDADALEEELENVETESTNEEIEKEATKEAI